MFNRTKKDKSLPESLGFSDRKARSISNKVNKIDKKINTKSGVILALAEEYKDNELLYAVYCFGTIIGLEGSPDLSFAKFLAGLETLTK